MKTSIIAVLATLLVATQAKIGFGGCPNIKTTVAFDDDMKTLSKVRLLYIDRLPSNLFTLAGLLLSKKYQTLDCLGYDDSDTVEAVLE